MLAASVMEFFTGALLPLPFFPEALQPIFYALPFASMQSTPFLIYTGYMRGREALLGLLVQAVWLLLLVVLGRLWMRRAVRRTCLLYTSCYTAFIGTETTKNRIRRRLYGITVR